MCEVNPYQLETWVYPNDPSTCAVRPVTPVRDGITHLWCTASMNSITQPCKSIGCSLSRYYFTLSNSQKDINAQTIGRFLGTTG
jgi:hypothetical protein